MHKPSQTRVVGYKFEGDYLEGPLEKMLEKAVKAGVVTQFDTGRGHLVWFNGPPGAALRKLRDEVEAYVKAGRS